MMSGCDIMNRSTGYNEFFAKPTIEPSEIEIRLFEHISKTNFNGELVITGCPTNSKGQPIWDSMDDMVSNPHSHGLIEAVSAISQIIKAIDIYLVYSDRTMPKLKVRFEANIKDVFETDSNFHNPTAWIHLGHGMLEHSYELFEDLEEWDSEEYESVPGISNGHENEDFISARWLRDAISKMESNILFMALPICWGKQISEVLLESQRILCVHAPISFKVSETLEFYDCDNSKVLPAHTLNAWSEWVRFFENIQRIAVIDKCKKLAGKEEE